MIREEKETRSLVNEINNKIEIEVEEIDLDSGKKKKISGMIHFPLNNILILSISGCIFIYSTMEDSFSKVNEFECRVKQLVKLNDDNFLTMEQMKHENGNYLDNFWVTGYSIKKTIKAKKLLPVISVSPYPILLTRFLFPYNHDLFILCYPNRESTLLLNSMVDVFNNLHKKNYLELYSFRDQKLVKNVNLLNLSIRIGNSPLITPSKKFKDQEAVYIYLQGYQEKICLVNLKEKDNGNKRKEYILDEELDWVTQISVFSNQEDEELVIITGDEGWIIIINFSKSVPEIQWRLDEDEEEFNEISFYLSIQINVLEVLESQFFFLGDLEKGKLTILELKRKRENVFSVLLSKQKIFKEGVEEIIVLSYTKKTISLMICGTQNICKLEIRGVELDSVVDENFKKDEIERRLFLCKSIHKYIFSNSEIKKKCFLDVKLSNLVITNVLKIFIV